MIDQRESKTTVKRYENKIKNKDQPTNNHKI